MRAGGSRVAAFRGEQICNVTLSKGLTPTHGIIETTEIVAPEALFRRSNLG
jgi:hypothetical protein